MDDLDAVRFAVGQDVTLTREELASSPGLHWVGAAVIRRVLPLRDGVRWYLVRRWDDVLCEYPETAFEEDE